MKEMLRRLRWHRHQSGDPHCKSNSSMTSDLCCFIRGENIAKTTAVREHCGKDVNFVTMATAMKEQQKRATVCFDINSIFIVSPVTRGRRNIAVVFVVVLLGGVDLC